MEKYRTDLAGKTLGRHTALQIFAEMWNQEHSKQLKAGCYNEEH